MKRIKTVNGYAIYQATTQRDADNYNCEIGCYNLYLSSDIRDFGLSCSYPEYDNIDSLSCALELAHGSNYAVACALADELSNSTIQDMDLVLEIERRLDAGEALETIRDSYNTWDQYFYDPSVVPYLDAALQDDPTSEHGGLDHLGETVRSFACDLGHPVNLAELNEALHKCGLLPVGDFCSDEEKMVDFLAMTKEEFLTSYSYLTEAEYDATMMAVAASRKLSFLAAVYDQYVTDCHLPDSNEEDLFSEDDVYDHDPGAASDEDATGVYLRDLYEIAPQAHIFIVTRADVYDLRVTSRREYTGGKADGDKFVWRVTPASYPMYKNVLEVEII